MRQIHVVVSEWALRLRQREHDIGKPRHAGRRLHNYHQRVVRGACAHYLAAAYGQLTGGSALKTKKRDKLMWGGSLVQKWQRFPARTPPDTTITSESDNSRSRKIYAAG
jgi:hypothetical protein